jgi:ASC-1-like (ASCH) protein
MTIIEKKIWPKYFEKIASGKKRYEFRLADFDVQEGDTLILKEWDPKSKTYTGRELERKITSTGRFDLEDSHWNEDEIREHGIHIMSLAETDE